MPAGGVGRYAVEAKSFSKTPHAASTGTVLSVGAAEPELRPARRWSVLGRWVGPLGLRSPFARVTVQSEVRAASGRRHLRLRLRHLCSGWSAGFYIFGSLPPSWRIPSRRRWVCDLAEPVAGERRPDGVALKGGANRGGAMRRLLLGAVLAGIAHSAAAQGHWYYCDPAHAYYPYVKACPVPWREVTPYPDGQDQQHESGPPVTQPAAPAPAAPAWVAPVTTVAPPPDSQPSATYRQGQADRQRWETWFGTLTGDYRAGAEYLGGQAQRAEPWVMQRCPVVNRRRLDSRMYCRPTEAHSLRCATKDRARLSPRMEQPYSACVADHECCWSP